MGTLLITGGGGFFGKSLLDNFARGRLQAHGISRIVVVARAATALRAKAPRLLCPAVRLVDCDVRTLDHLFGADVVIHAAASADPVRYRVDPGTEQAIIVEGTRRVLDLARASRARLPVVHVSSGAVYGRQPREVLALDEDRAFLGAVDAEKSAYADAKRVAELLVAESAAAGEIDVAIARCFAFVGPWLPRQRHFAIGNFLRNALAGEPIEVRAKHEVVRSYLYADDLVDWLLRIVRAASPACPIYNVGSDEAITIRALAALIGEMAGVSVILPEPSLADEALPPDRYIPDISRARRDLGLHVTTPLHEAIERTIATLRSYDEELSDV